MNLGPVKASCTTAAIRSNRQRVSRYFRTAPSRRSSTYPVGGRRLAARGCHGHGRDRAHRVVWFGIAYAHGSRDPGDRRRTNGDQVRRGGGADSRLRVINVPPAQSALSPALYVPAKEFAAQMRTLKDNGWRAVTLDELEGYWTRKTPLGSGKPIVISFDNGYASQYANALPVLKQLGWTAVENLQVSGLPPSEGGLIDAQVRGLIGAGWELDTNGVSQSDLTALDPGQLSTEVARARQTLRSRYRVPVNWFSYPSGRYNANVVAAVRAAGYRGATTTASGWASPHSDPFRLPRLQVVGGTSPSRLLAQIMAARQTTAAPAASNGP
jgi:peptidoglycan/xylan/chitin deacetylase (PgdA/CDA1 family)